MAWGPSGGMAFWLAWPRCGSSRSGFLWGLLLLGMLMSGRQVEGWSWLMADTKVALPTCPGRCLEVDDSKAAGVYSGKVVGFGSCQGSAANQQWVVESVDDNSNSNRITILEPNGQQPLGTLCLQPNRTGQSVVLAPCTNSPDQIWVVEEGRVRTQESLTMGDSGPGEPLNLAMLYPKDLQDSDPKRPWHSCILASSGDSRLYGPSPNMTDVVSVVPRSSYGNSSSFSGQSTGGSVNDIVRNGGFELSSYLDDSLSESNLSVEMQSSSDDIFGLCFWSVPNGTVTLRVYTSAAGSSGSLSVLLNGQKDQGALSQVVPTTPGSFYVLVFEVAAPGCSDVSQASVRVSVSPSSLESQTHNISGSGASQDLVWGTPVFSFQAESDWTTLTFESLTPPETGCGPAIDNVRVLNMSTDAALPPTGVSGYSPPSPQAGLLPGDPNSSISQQGHEDGYPSVTLSRGAISGIVLGAAAVAFGVGSLAFLLLILPLSNKLNKRNSSEQMLPKAGSQWDSPSSPSSSSSVNTVPVHELE